MLIAIQASISGTIAVFEEAKKRKNWVWCPDSAICFTGLMPQNVAWSYLNISIHYLAAEMKLISNQQNQKSTEFLFLKQGGGKAAANTV